MSVVQDWSALGCKKFFIWSLPLKLCKSPQLCSAWLTLQNVCMQWIFCNWNMSVPMREQDLVASNCKVCSLPRCCSCITQWWVIMTLIEPELVDLPLHFKFYFLLSVYLQMLSHGFFLSSTTSNIKNYGYVYLLFLTDGYKLTEGSPLIIPLQDF